MYLDYWQLSSKPFESRMSDLAFYFSCESHEGALHKLRYAITEGAAAAALAGPSGVGKTLLVDRLAMELNPETNPMVRLVYPQMSDRELLAYLADRLGSEDWDEGNKTVEESVRRLEAITETNANEGRLPLVVIEESHLLEDSGLLETVRMLTNFTYGGSPAMSLLLVGQMGLLSSISRWPTLDERLTVKTLIKPYQVEETAGYVRSRLEAAGATRDLFDEQALKHVHSLSGGSPRRINRLCDLALVVGYATGSPQISAATLDSVHTELVSVGANRAA